MGIWRLLQFDVRKHREEHKESTQKGVRELFVAPIGISGRKRDLQCGRCFLRMLGTGDGGAEGRHIANSMGHILRLLEIARSDFWKGGLRSAAIGICGVDGAGNL